MKRLATLFALALLLSGCGGSSSSAAGQAHPITGHSSQTPLAQSLDGRWVATVIVEAVVGQGVGIGAEKIQRDAELAVRDGRVESIGWGANDTLQVVDWWLEGWYQAELQWLENRLEEPGLLSVDFGWDEPGGERYRWAAKFVLVAPDEILAWIWREHRAQGSGAASHSIFEVTFRPAGL